MKTTELERAVLDLVNRAGYRPTKPRKIAQELGIPKDRASEVKQAIKGLVAQGRLAYGESHLVVPPGAGPSQGSRIVGVFQRTQRGFGFVRPRHRAAGEQQPVDVYIPAKKASDASTGDVVLVRVDTGRGQPGKGPRGEIVQIVERQTHQFVGTYFEATGSGMVHVDGTVFTQPIQVGDPGAKGARPDDKVVFEMIRFPSNLNEGEGVITEVLGPRGTPGVDTLSIIREFDLPDDFAEDALDDARRAAKEFDESVSEDRLDLTGQTVLTIDPVNARDFDDAISLEELPGGHWRLGVHIADVAHFVQPKTALDREARDRATSVYLPDRVIPMLPEIISNSLASLQPGKVRYTKTVLMEFTAEGIRVDAQHHSAAIKSDKRLAYEQVDEFLADPAPWRRKLGTKVHELLGRMHKLAMILRRRRLERGALELSMPEVKVDLDREGRVSGAHVVENTESHQVIEEFMLAANEAVAEILQARELHFLRRIHAAPSERKLKALEEFVGELGFRVDGLRSRFDLQKLLRAVAGRPEERAVNFALLRSMQRAEYGPMPEEHYALASECYCHFTSPIRRYPDLTVHRLLDAILTGRKPRNDFDELTVVGDHCSQRERRAERAERELTKLKLLVYLSERLGEQMDAVVTGVESFGLFVQGIELPAEGLIHVDSLLDDYYSFDRTTHTLAGRRAENIFRLGDLVRVAVARVDLDRRELDFRLVKRKPRPPRKADAAKPSKKAEKAKRAEKGEKAEKGKKAKKKDAGPKKPARAKKKKGGRRGKKRG